MDRFDVETAEEVELRSSGASEFRVPNAAEDFMDLAAGMNLREVAPPSIPEPPAFEAPAPAPRNESPAAAGVVCANPSRSCSVPGGPTRSGSGPAPAPRDGKHCRSGPFPALLLGPGHQRTVRSFLLSGSPGRPPGGEQQLTAAACRYRPGRCNPVGPGWFCSELWPGVPSEGAAGPGGRSAQGRSGLI